MIISTDEAKQYAQIDTKYDDALIEGLILASEEYLFNATGKKFTSNSNLAVLYCKVLVKDWYDNRDFSNNKKVSDKVRYTLTSIMAQLQFASGGELNGA